MTFPKATRLIGTTATATAMATHATRPAIDNRRKPFPVMARLCVALGALTIVLGAGLLVPTPTVRAEPIATTAVVLKVVDGDTIDILDDVRGRLRIRVLGIDTPETKKPGYTVGCWGPEATEFAKSALLGQRVAFAIDPTQGMYDRYGRTLAYLDKPDGWDYSIEAARAGVAHSYIYDSPATRYPEVAAAEREARDAQRGMWGPPCNGNTASVKK